MTEASNGTRSSGAAVVVMGVLSVVVLYGDRHTAHSLTPLAWIAVAAVGCGGLRVGWRVAFSNDPSTSARPKWTGAALTLGIAISLGLSLIPAHSGFSRTLYWSAGSFFVAAFIGFYANSLWRSRRS